MTDSFDSLESGPSEHVRRRLGVTMPHSQLLGREVFDDLDPELGGIGWWSPDTPTQYRIRIGDFLYQAQAGITAAVVEAKVSLDDLRLLWRHQDGQWAEHLKKTAPTPSSPAPETDDDYLRPIREDSLLGSFFTAVGRILDHIASVTIGVFDLQMDIVKADWGGLLKAPQRCVNDLAELVRRSGPPGWLDWALQMRNVLTHRPRPMAFKQMHLDGIGLLIPTISHPADRVRIVLHLPDRPNLSFVEALRLAEGPTDMYLTESASVTLERTLKAVIELAESASELAHTHWLTRRSDRAPQKHHEVQWRSQNPGERFAGFAPGSLPVQVNGLAMLVSPEMERRVRAAHLFDDQRETTWASD